MGSTECNTLVIFQFNSVIHGCIVHFKLPELGKKIKNVFGTHFCEKWGSKLIADKKIIDFLQHYFKVHYIIIA